MGFKPAKQRKAEKRARRKGAKMKKEICKQIGKLCHFLGQVSIVANK